MKGISHAVPWRELAEKLYPDLRSAMSVSTWGEGTVIEDARQLEYGPDRVREMLAQAPAQPHPISRRFRA